MATQFAPGRYLVRVRNQKFIESSQKGTPGFLLEFSVLQSLDKRALPTKPFGKALTMWITENNAQRVLHDLQSLGYKGKTLEGVDPDTAGFHDFSGADIELECSHEDTETGRFERWSVPARPSLKDKSKLRQIDRMLAATPAPTPINGGANNLAITDDDVPF